MQELLIYQFSNCCRSFPLKTLTNLWTLAQPKVWEKLLGMVVITDLVISHYHSLISHTALYNQ